MLVAFWGAVGVTPMTGVKRAGEHTLRYKNYNKSIDIFWFAQKGNSLPGEQNKIYINNNDDNLFQQHLRVQQYSTPSRRTTRTVIKRQLRQFHA